jgi:hypothetical protein
MEEEKMEEVLGPIDAIVLRSPNREFQVRLFVGDDGSLNASLLLRRKNNKYEPQQGVSPARLALVRRGPQGEIFQFSPG